MGTLAAGACPMPVSYRMPAAERDQLMALVEPALNIFIRDLQRRPCRYGVPRVTGISHGSGLGDHEPESLTCGPYDLRDGESDAELA
jgi:hypothetical protein